MIVPTLALVSMMLPGCEDCLVENTGQPCIDMMDTDAASFCWTAYNQGDVSAATCVRTLASLWGNATYGVAYQAALTYWRIHDLDCGDPETGQTQECLDLFTQCEGYESPPTCLAMSQASCEVEAWAGSGDAAGWVCASAID